MQTYEAGQYDIAVVGAGHAGIEAALAAARLGARVIVFTVSLDGVGNMPCNPSIGGTAKGHLVREIDALGGEMGRAADECFIQTRMLNRGKGPAVYSLRAQIDRAAYRTRMKRVLENTPNLTLRQSEVVDFERDGQGRLCALLTRTGGRYAVRAAILATGTYLAGRCILGETILDSGPDGMQAAHGLEQALREAGVSMRRFKTGTPSRVHADSIDYSKTTPQPGDEPPVPFSFQNLDRPFGENRALCYLTYTTPETHRVILDNLHTSPLFSGVIEGIGPRYCPSIEDKVNRFRDKQRHPLFIEPLGMDTKEMYLQGMSSSLPEWVQLRFLRTIPGLERVEVMRSAYAIEYDCVDPQELSLSLEFRRIPGLFGAGQFNGSSGYEEAAAQGLMAGINAARQIQGLPPVILGRDSSYIGTLIDDLVTKGTAEPYRMMTSRSEYRLILRQDNADERLSPIGHEIGLVSDEAYRRMLAKKAAIAAEVERLSETPVSATTEVNAFLEKNGSAPLSGGTRLIELLRRPELGYEALAPLDPQRPELPGSVREGAEIEVKYEGYIRRQKAQVREFRRMESRALPADLDYAALPGLRIEARQKLAALRPQNLGQASRISGVSPADVSVLMIALAQRKEKEHD